MTPRERIMRAVQEFPESSSAYIATQAGLPHAIVAQELPGMVADGLLLAEVMRAESAGQAIALYSIAAESIGICDLCGRTDHHLVDDICPVCRPRVATVGRGAETPERPMRGPGIYLCGEGDEL